MQKNENEERRSQSTNTSLDAQELTKTGKKKYTLPLPTHFVQTHEQECGISSILGGINPERDVICERGGQKSATK
jgi:hypothetical protein